MAVPESPSSNASQIIGVISRSFDPHEFAVAAQSNSWAGVAALAFLIWDAMIFFSDEVEYIWKGPNTWIRYMYLFVRHVPLLVNALSTCTTGVQFSEHSCRSLFAFEASATTATVLAVELILVLRVYALYNRSQVVLWTLCLMFISEAGVMIMSVAKTMPRFRFTPQCLTTTTPSIFMASWLSSLAFESVLFAFTLVRFSRIIHRDLTTGKHTFVYVFIRDGIWAFALIFAIFFISTLVYVLDSPRASTCFYWAFAIVSFTGSHLLLNLRQLTSNRSQTSEDLSGNHDLMFKHTIPGHGMVSSSAMILDAETSPENQADTY